jgi:hypothetical protein
MDRREELAAYARTRAEAAQAEVLLIDSLSVYQAASDSGAIERLAAGGHGVVLARRRLWARDRAAQLAQMRLTGGRSIDEVMWSLPDDL